MYKGLRKSIETNDGITHSEAFWRIVEVRLDAVNEKANIQLVAYHSEDAFDNGKNNIGVARNVTVSPVDLTDIDTMRDLTDAMYAKVKNIDADFTDAELVESK